MYRGLPKLHRRPAVPLFDLVLFSMRPMPLLDSTTQSSAGHSKSSKIRNVLLICDLSKSHAATVIDSIAAFSQSKHRIYKINPLGVSLPRHLDLRLFDVVVIHWSIFCIHDHYLGPAWREAIAAFPGLKIQFIQDDYRWVRKIAACIRGMGIHVLYTLAPEKIRDLLWEPELLPNVEKRTYLAGYVPDYLLDAKVPPPSKRKIDVGYRGRSVPYWLGRLALEKRTIGPDFLQHAEPFDVKCDIAWREQDRIYGKRWVEFLSSCRACLGTESGASIVDFDGDVQRDTDAYLATHPNADFEEVFREVLAPHEGNLTLNVISPRMFEAAALRTALVLFRGDYSHVIEPWRHYIPLEKDFSNIKQVIECVRDDAFITTMTTRAYDEIIASRRFSFASHIADFDQTVDVHALRFSQTAATGLVGALRIMLRFRSASIEQRIAAVVNRGGRWLKRGNGRFQLSLLGQRLKRLPSRLRRSLSVDNDQSKEAAVRRAA